MFLDIKIFYKPRVKTKLAKLIPKPEQHRLRHFTWKLGSYFASVVDGIN